MRSGSLKDLLAGKYIICSCEGVAEKTVIDLLLDSGRLCFERKDLVRESCTRIRTGTKIAQEFLNQEYEKDIAIIRILDREKENLKLPRIYAIRDDIFVFNIVTKPEIEILHIYAEDVELEYGKQKNRGLKPSEFCKKYFCSTSIKSEQFIKQLYINNIDKLIYAIEKYERKIQQKAYCLNDLIIN